MVSKVYPGGMLFISPMIPKLRVFPVVLCQVFAAMKWLKGEITIVAPDLSNSAMGPDCNPSLICLWCASHLKIDKDDIYFSFKYFYYH